MRFGVCAGPENSREFKDAGFEFLEIRVNKHLMPLADEATFAPVRRELLDSALPVETANCFITLPLVGPERDLSAIRRYVAVAMRRAREVGVKLVVFGSGGARRIPDGYPENKARAELIEFARLSADAAALYGATVALEPLHECNTLNYTGECGEFVEEAGHPAFGLLVDLYHFGQRGDRWEDLIKYGRRLIHTHVATYPKRRSPGTEEFDFAPFFQALKNIGYTGRMSLETNEPLPELLAAAPQACRTLRDAASL